MICGGAHLSRRCCLLRSSLVALHPATTCSESDMSWEDIANKQRFHAENQKYTSNNSFRSTINEYLGSNKQQTNFVVQQRNESHNYTLLQLRTVWKKCAMKFKIISHLACQMRHHQLREFSMINWQSTAVNCWLRIFKQFTIINIPLDCTAVEWQPKAFKM